MKHLNKFLTFILLAVLTLTLTACGNIPLSTDGFFWFEDSTSFPNGYVEELTYDVSLTHTTPSNSSEVKLDGYSLEITNGVYKTKLETKKNTNGDYYVYTTSLVLEGSYVTPDSSTEFTDTFTTNSEFYKDLTPIKTKKSYSSELSAYSYEYEITYSNNTANVSLTEYLNTQKQTNSTFSFDKYNESAFIDNDLMLLYGRLFNIDSEFSQSFNTIDALSKKTSKMNYRAGISNEILDVKSLDNYAINGVAPTEPKINCARVGISIADTFSGSTIETYYATDHKTHRHRLVETYTKLTGNVGYLKFSLKSATVNY